MITDPVRGETLAATAATTVDTGKFKSAIFAGGCFWCMQPPYDKLEGVVSTTVGYTGGSGPAPTYEEISTGTTGYREAIQVVYDPVKVTYRQLLKIYWLSIDPTDPGGQFADQGTQYEPAIYYTDDDQKLQAEKSRKELTTSGRFTRPIVVSILPATLFYAAEQYHQKYYQKNSLHYKLYRKGSGREDFLQKTWGNEVH